MRQKYKQFIPYWNYICGYVDTNFGPVMSNFISVLCILTLSKTSPCVTCLQYGSFENTFGTGEIAHDEQFLRFQQCFFYPLGEFSAIFIEFKTVLCKPFQFGGVQNLLFGKGLIGECNTILSAYTLYRHLE